MRTTERLIRLKEWLTKELCAGRMMKAPAKNQDIGTIHRQEPACYLGWAPSRVNKVGAPVFRELPQSTVPCILVMPNQSYAHYVEEKRFDRYNNVHRPQDMAENLGVSILFCVYEPGVRLPGFIDSVGPQGGGMDESLILEGTEQGLFAVYNWIDDCKAKLLGGKTIPKTDLSVQEQSVTYGLYTDQNFVVDTRPIYYGFVNVVFNSYSNEELTAEIEALL